MITFRKELDDTAREAVFSLNRLIAIRVRAQCDRAGAVARAGKFCAQQFHRVCLGEKACFEIESWGEFQIGVGRPSVAVDAAMLTATVRIDRLAERNVR